MLEKLLLAATVTFSIHFLLPAHSSDIAQTDWQVLSARKTTTTQTNLVDKQLLAEIWQPTDSRR